MTQPLQVFYFKGVPVRPCENFLIGFLIDLDFDYVGSLDDLSLVNNRFENIFKKLFNY